MSLSPATAQPTAKNAAPSPAVMECMGHLNTLREQFPDWFDDYDDAMVDVVADRKTIEKLLETAPNEFLKGLMYGKLAMRMQISALTERSF